MRLKLKKAPLLLALLLIQPLAWSQQKLLRFRGADIDPISFAQTKFDIINSRYGIVQFDSAKNVRAELITQTGAEILFYIPDNAYAVRWDKQAQQKLASEPTVRFSGQFRPAYKANPQNLKQHRLPDGKAIFTVVGFPGESIQQLELLIAKLLPKARILQSAQRGAIASLNIDLSKTDVESALYLLRGIDGIAWIDPYSLPQLNNADSVGAIQANGNSGGPPPSNTPIWDQDIIGTGQIVAVADSGLDRNEDFFIRYNNGNTVVEAITDAELVVPPAIGTLYPERKLVGYWYPPGASPYDDNVACSDGGNRSGYHGTHVTGSVAGDSETPSSPTDPAYDRGDGMAPNAQILFQDIGNDTTGCLSGQISAFELGEQAINAGAFIATGSFGFPPPTDANGVFDPSLNGYFFGDFEADRASYAFEDLLILRSAGNSGSTANTIGHVANAKHVLAVGATNHGNDSTVATFSSRGPAHDGRIKPDIVAPGVSIVSASGDDQDANPPPQFGNQPSFSLKQGTSMSTPTTAGAAALLRQYFVDGFYPTGARNNENQQVPSGALMKATLLNGTLAYPNTPASDSGWGRVWLDNNLYFSGDDRQLRVWDRPNASGLKTGESESFDIQVAAGEEFRATLVWRDPPGAGFAGPSLVNNLDLEVEANGNLYLGNVFAGGQSTSGGNQDQLNPTEQVRFANPTAGIYTVRVKASSVPGDGSANSDLQGYALVVSNAQCNSAVNSAAQIELNSSQDGIAVNFDSVAGASGYQLYRTQGSCSADPGSFRYIGQNADNSLVDQTTQGGFEYAYRVRAVDACGEAQLSNCRSILSQAACTLTPSFDPSQVSVSRIAGQSCGVNINWEAGQTACPGTDLSYNVYRSTDPEFTPSSQNLVAGDVSETRYEDLTVDPLVTYYYVVRAQDNAADSVGLNSGNETSGLQRNRITTFTAGSVAGTFEDDPDQISYVDLDPAWQITSTNASTGSFSYHNARDGETYRPQTCARMVSPPLNLQNGSPVLNYDARFNLEADWDGIVVEISSDGGQSWQDLAPDGGYPGNLSMTEPNGVPINECGYPKEQGAFNGVQDNFDTYSSDLSAFAGEEVLIRWSFTSDPGLEFEGFYLDNIQVSQASVPSACTADSSSDLSGAWYNSSQNGHGWLMEVLEGSGGNPDVLNAYWYVYENGQPVWLIGQGPLENGSASLSMLVSSGADFPPNFNPDDVQLDPWGTLNFDFEQDGTGRASWQSSIVGFSTSSMDIEQLATISQTPESCRSGSYFNAQQAGHGFVMEVLNFSGEDVLLLAWYVYLNGEQVWLLGQAPLVNDTADIPLNIFDGAGFPPEFDPTEVNIAPWGTINVNFTGPDSADLDWETQISDFPNGSLSVERLTSLKGHQCQ